MYMVRQGDLKYIYHAPLLSGERFGLHVPTNGVQDPEATRRPNPHAPNHVSAPPGSPEP